MTRAARVVAPYAAALAAVTTATVLRVAVGGWLAEDPSLLFLAAVALTAWRGGRWPGILAVALSALSQARYFIAPDAVFLATWAQAAALALWSMEGALVCVILGALRTARERAAEGERRLEEQVAERTAQLAAANEDLRREAVERVEMETQLRHAQKMEAIGQLAGGIAHDFNNVLSIILSLVALNLDELGPGGVRDDFDEIGKAAERAAALTRQLLAFSRHEVIQPKVLDLRRCIDEMDRMLEQLVGTDVRVVRLAPAQLGSVRMDPGHVSQVLINLVANARDAMPGGGTLTIETSDVVIDEADVREHRDARAGRHVRLSVRDTGAGMDAATRARIFEPFFTTKEAGKGTGLGLSTVFGIVRQAGGSISVASEEGKGTRFDIDLPVVDEAPESDAVASERPEVHGTETVLLVDDEDDVRAVAREVLRRSGYRVLEARDGIEALRVWDDGADAIDVVLTDIGMPNMGGRELAKRLATRRPGIKVLCFSGHIDRIHAGDDALGKSIPFLQKPFTPRALTHKLRDVLDARPSGATSLWP